MAKRGVVCDYAGDELFKDDLITYGARQGNRIRMADAVVLKVTAKVVDGRLRPMLKVRPTGPESGFVKRRSFRSLWISAEHARLIQPAEERA